MIERNIIIKMQIAKNKKIIRKIIKIAKGPYFMHPLL